MFKSMQGEILHVEDLGAQASGLRGFEWRDILKVLDANEYITVEAFADHGGLEGASASVFSKCWLLQLAVQMACSWMFVAMGISVPVRHRFRKVLAISCFDIILSF